MKVLGGRVMAAQRHACVGKGAVAEIV